MFFKRIEMHGFKSFAEPAIIEFDKGITCIVGPNGSGKSNISDAIRWVLGEQSPKMLRGGKMEDVIFSGTSVRKSRGMAEVTLVIDNGDGRLPIEYSEVAITRRMYRSGESEYAINNNKCRMRDIKELLTDTGIGVDGYSLIGQGKISDIISNKTESIREIFEETAGVVSYRTKKAEAERKLVASNINMDRVNDILEEIESRIDGLRQDSEKATEYLQLKERHRELEINITINSIESLKEKIDIYNEDIRTLSEQGKKATESKIKTEEDLLKLSDKIKDLSELINDKKNIHEELSRAMGKAFGDSRVSRERLNSIKRDIERLQREIKDFDEKINIEEAKKKELKSEKEKIDEQLTKASEKLEKELAKSGDVKTHRDKINNRISRKKDELFDMSKKLSSMSGEKGSFVNLLENLADTEKKATVNFKTYQETAAEIEEQLVKENENRDIFFQKNGQAKLNLVQNEKFGTKLKEQIDQLETVLKNKEIRQRELISRRSTIGEMEANYEGYNGGVRFVMKQKFPGVLGTVGDLGKPKVGFEIALETALGGHIQNIVCKDEYSVKTAINSLKKAKAGRVTFLPISEIEGQLKRNNQLESEPGFLGYADQCIGFDSAYNEIFAYLLGNTIVVENMDDAMEISKKYGRSFKYVTLEGEIFNTSGAITGGRYKNKTANLFERKGEIAKLESELKNIQQQINLEKEEYDSLNEQWENNKHEHLIYTQEERETLNEITKSSSKIAGLNDRKEEIRRTLKTWQESLKNAKTEAVKVNEKIESIDDEMAKTTETMEKLQQEILRETEEFESMESSIRESGEYLTQVRLEVSKWQNEHGNIANLLNFSTLNTDGFRNEIERRRKQIENLKMDFEGVSKGIDVHDKLAAEKKIQKEKLEIELKGFLTDKERAEGEVSKLNANKENIYNKLEQIQSQKYEIEVKLARQEGQMDSHKSKLWEDFQVSYAQALSMKQQDFVVSTAVKENRNVKNRIRELGEVNVGAISEYAKVNERYKFMMVQREDIVKSTEELRQVIEDLDKIIRVTFKTGFDSVAGYFEEIFKEFFGGGQAKIVLENEDDPLNSSIEIIAQPPGKQLKNINLMSGGEKTMTAIALMFAVVKTKPTPCCILDEVEAALDDHNIHVFANYLRKFENIQFTLITHQKTTMEHADVMYGVTMPEKGVSKVFSLKMDDDSVKID